MFFSQLLLFIEMLRRITLKSIPWMKMSEDCWECLDSHSCAETEGEFWAPILYFHMGGAVSQRSKNWIPFARTVKESDIGQWFIFRSGVSVTRTRLREAIYPSMQWPNTEPMGFSAEAKTTRCRVILCALYLRIKDVYSSGLLVFILIRRQTHAGSWSHRWEML